jgi:phosphatidylglycerophosphatase A
METIQESKIFSNVLSNVTFKKDIVDFELSPQDMSFITDSINKLYQSYHSKKVLEDRNNITLKLFKECLEISFKVKYMKDSNKKDLGKYIFDEVSKRVGFNVTSDKFSDDIIDTFEFMIHNKRCCF